ncbi:hypothetical protein AMTR_s00016p00215240 [Amborella trichopoda]|uniref:Uncharacterized protein n=1 Tax=Amborella trichopoda TaxID=13333 RepID=W1PF73_AMBTC|nr:hypothetical protein AMTR_s00016p00215240 [Amborella trichopoda]
MLGFGATTVVMIRPLRPPAVHAVCMLLVTGDRITTDYRVVMDGCDCSASTKGHANVSGSSFLDQDGDRHHEQSKGEKPQVSLGGRCYLLELKS